jgi:sortase A
MSRTARALLVAAGVFMAGGLLALGYSAYVVIDARTYQAAEQRRFEYARLAAAVKPAPDAELALAAEPAPIEGHPIGEIRIPRVGLTAIVVQGDSAAILRRAVGHLAETALPGQSGNVVLAGHRDTFFRPLKGVQVGDVITLKTGGGDFIYLVESTSVVPPGDLRVLQPTGRRTLTLITCFPFAFVGSAPDRFVVQAREADALR